MKYQIQLNMHYSLNARDFKYTREEWDELVLPIIKKHHFVQTYSNIEHGICTYEQEVNNREQAVAIRNQLDEAYFELGYRGGKHWSGFNCIILED